MKCCPLLMCVIVVVYSADQHQLEHLFGGMAQQLAQYFRGKYNPQHIVTQPECLADCKAHLGLEDAMCQNVCFVAGDKFPHVEPQLNST